MGHSDPISFESEFEAPEAVVEMAFKSPEDGGASVEGAENRPVDKLVNVEVILKTLKDMNEWTNLCVPGKIEGHNKRPQSLSKKKTLKMLQENT